MICRLHDKEACQNLCMSSIHILKSLTNRWFSSISWPYIQVQPFWDKCPIPMTNSFPNPSHHYKGTGIIKGRPLSWVLYGCGNATDYNGPPFHATWPDFLICDQVMHSQGQECMQGNGNTIKGWNLISSKDRAQKTKRNRLHPILKLFLSSINLVLHQFNPPKQRQHRQQQQFWMSEM